MNTIIKYQIFGNKTEFSVKRSLETPEDITELLKEHVGSRWMTISPLSLPEVSIKVVKNSIIETFAYNKGIDIVNFLHNPESIYDDKPSFPVIVVGELKEHLEEGADGL